MNFVQNATLIASYGTIVYTKEAHINPTLNVFNIG